MLLRRRNSAQPSHCLLSPGRSRLQPTASAGTRSPPEARYENTAGAKQLGMGREGQTGLSISSLPLLFTFPAGYQQSLLLRVRKDPREGVNAGATPTLSNSSQQGPTRPRTFPRVAASPDAEPGAALAAWGSLSLPGIQQPALLRWLQAPGDSAGPG